MTHDANVKNYKKNKIKTHATIIIKEKKPLQEFINRCSSIISSLMPKSPKDYCVVLS